MRTRVSKQNGRREMMQMRTADKQQAMLHRALANHDLVK